jgi:hypothetical protein
MIGKESWGLADRVTAISGSVQLLSENSIERLRTRAAWFRSLASEATDDEAARALLQLASETDQLNNAVQDDPNRED